MTPLSLLQFAEAILWCVAVFTSIAGFGAILLTLIGIRPASISLAFLSGTPAVILLGGILNLLHAISRPVLFTVIAIGLLGFFLLRPAFAETMDDHPSPPASRSRLATILLVLFALLFTARAAATPHWSFYQNSDDYNYYLAVPEKNLELHSFAPDPFSERRIMSSVGGNYFLQDLLLAALPLENVQMADRTLGLFLLALLAFAIAAHFSLTPVQRALLALLTLFIPQLTFNLTFMLLPSALLFGLVYLAADRRTFAARPLLLGALIGAVAGATGSMKSSYMPHGVFFATALAALIAYRQTLAIALRFLVASAASCLAVMLPWMIASRATTGTLFYPSLGRGFHYTAYHFFPTPGKLSLQVLFHVVLPFSAPMLVLLATAWLWGRLNNRAEDERNDAILALMAAAFVSAVLIGISTGGESIRRYNYPAYVPAILLLFVIASRKLNADPGRQAWRIFQAAAVLLCIATGLVIGLNQFTREFHQIPVGLRQSLRPFSIVPPEVQAEYATVQNLIPNDGAVLATVQNSFLLDYRTHTIDIADFPGAAGPPPGWPNRSNGEALAAYLQSHGIRYLLYSYADWVYSDAHAQEFINDHVHHTQWLRDEASITTLAHQQYAELAHSRRKLYDDGKIYVLDLATPAR